MKNNTFAKCYLALFPLGIEKKHFCNSTIAKSYESENIRIGKSTLSYFAGANLICGVGGHGKVSFALQTQYILTQRPDIQRILCVGSAGGLAEGICVGDIVVAEDTLEHDYRQAFNPHATKPSYKSSDSMLELCKGVKNPELKYHFGTIASGDEDIVTPGRAQELYQETKALAVAWEGAGGAKAAKFCQSDYIEIRGITDNARTNVAGDFKKNLPIVMDQLAQFIFCLLP